MAHSIDNLRHFFRSDALFALIAINACLYIIIFVASFFIHGDAEFLFSEWLCVPAAHSMFISHPWTPLTYMFVQFGFFHMLFNMLWLYWFGRFLIDTLQDLHLLTLYIGGGLTGALFFILIRFIFAGYFPSVSFLCGSSAAVLAVVTATSLRNGDIRLNLFLFGEVRLKWIGLACIILTLLGTGGGNAGGESAHVGGIVAGLLFVWSLKKGIDPTRIFSKIILKTGPVGKTERSKNIRPKVIIDGDELSRRMSGRLSDPERLDMLLDKIRISGYQSLTSQEKNELNALSRNLEKTR